MTDYKRPVPDNRTIVPGVWSDLLDAWLDAANSDEGEKVSEITSLSSLIAEKQTIDRLDLILKELKVISLLLAQGQNEDSDSIREGMKDDS